MRITSGTFHPATTIAALGHAATALAVLGLVAGPMVPLAHAQPAVPTSPEPASPEPADQIAAADPPARVGRLARMVGVVSAHAADQTAWTPAALNYPVTSGDAFWTEPQAEADLEVGATHIALASQTEFEIGTLDDSTLAATQAQGETYLRLRDVPAGSIVRIATPRGLVSIAVAGRYAVVAGDTDHPTTVTVVEGGAHIGGGALSLNVGPHQTVALTGSTDFQSGVGPEQDDAFLRAQLDRERPAPSASRVARYAPPPVVAQMTGADALADTGEWARTPEYGEVWYPPVQRDWVPYRDGHWAWVAPWGWTWVDNAPWGFAPSHYGRWVEVHDRWGWEPVVVGAPVQETPCYAPALVSWVDVAAGAAVGVAAAAAVGWIPLGPREPYYPPYRASDRYVQHVNANSVANNVRISNVTNNRLVQTFVNRGAATVVPATAMVASQPIATRVQPVQAQAFAANRAIVQPPVRPTLATAGVTPAVARALNLPPGGGEPVRPAAPGPALQLHQPGRVPFPGTPTPANPGVAPGAAPGPEPARPGLGLAGAAAIGGAAALGGAALLARPAGQAAPPPSLARPGEPPLAPRGAAPPVAPQTVGPAARAALPPLATSRETGRPTTPPGSAPRLGGATQAGPAQQTRPAPQAGPATQAGPAPQPGFAPQARPTPQAGAAPQTPPAPQAGATPQLRPAPGAGPARTTPPPAPAVPTAGAPGNAAPRPAVPATPGLVPRPNAPGLATSREPAVSMTPAPNARPTMNNPAARAGNVPTAPRPVEMPARPTQPPPVSAAPRQSAPPAFQRPQSPVAAAPQPPAAPPRVAPPPAPPPVMRAPPAARPAPPPAAARPAPEPRPAPPAAAHPAPQREKDPRHP